jgi:predicted RNA methylase
VAICARIARHGLIAAECDALLGGVPDDDGVADVERSHGVERAAFAQTTLTVLAEAESLTRLIDAVAGTDFDAERFRIDVHDPANRLGLDSSDVASRLADVIDHGPDLRNPVHRFMVVATAHRVRFGAVDGITDARYRQHESKPWTTSSSLDHRFSRGLVNLVPEARSILDPCCGAGSIVLEAASLGLGAVGVDWKNAMAGMTRENLAHFGYTDRPDVAVHRSDARDIDVRADAVVTDLPYGHAIERDDESVRAILRQCTSLAPAGVFVAQHDISDWLIEAGHEVLAVHTVVKRRGFTRHVHVTRC